MPGTPPTTPRLLIPRYTNPDATQYASQMNAASDMIDAKAHKITPLVSALPGSPADGDQILFQNAAMATAGIVWRLQYRAAITAWENQSSGWLSNGNSGDITIASDNIWVDGSGGFDVPVVAPLSGQYEIQMKLSYVNTGGWTWNTMQCGFTVAAGTPNFDLVLSKNMWQGSTPNANAFARLGGTVRATGLVAGTSYGIRYRRLLYSEQARGFTLSGRRLSIRLIRT